jgi:hypothetical protein
MTTRSCVIVCALAALTAAGACSRREENAPCVATPKLTLARDRAAIGSPLAMTYRFDVAAPIPQDYWVFVHVFDDQGERLWVDDHQPPTPTSKWRQGEPVEYTRTVFVPNYPYIGPAHIRIGLYQPSASQRLPLCATDLSRREYEVAKLELLPLSQNIFLIYKEGWHPSEVASDDPNNEWQWTKKTATIAFRNPKKDATLYLEYDARTDQFSPPQQVTIRSGDQMVGSFAADSKDKKLISMPIEAKQLGSGDMAELTLDVDRTFKPGGGDIRELGIRVFHTFVEPK